MMFLNGFVVAAALVAPILPVMGHNGQYTQFVNHCDRPIAFHQAFPTGPNGEPGYDGPHYILAPNGGEHTIEMHQPIGDHKQGISTKFHWAGESHLDGVMQHEYTVSYAADSFGVSWDGSLVDGAGPGINGPGPFSGVNVKMTPIGNSDYDRYWDCAPILCWANQVCHGVYLYWNDNTKTLTCSADIEAFTIDFCAPDDLMHR